MDLTIGSLNFGVRSLGSLRLSDPIYSGLPASKPTVAAASESFVSSSSKVNSTVSVKPTESKRVLTDPLDEILYNLDFKDATDLLIRDKKADERWFTLLQKQEEKMLIEKECIPVNKCKDDFMLLTTSMAGMDPGCWRSTTSIKTRTSTRSTLKWQQRHQLVHLHSHRRAHL
jgi:hypothetical protein